jgi:uncharacterized protein YbcV (DUF1398 family)
MDTHTHDIIRECTARSDANTITFPEVVTKLMTVGVEQYHADLIRSEKTYYLPNGESLVTPADRPDGTAPQAFSAEGVQAAVRAIQQGDIDYREFCRRIIAAGCVSYVVSIAGKRAIYSGRTGDCYVEHFPKVA